MQLLDALEMLLKLSLDRGRQHRHPVLGAFSVPHGDLVVAEADVLHPHAQGFREPHSRAVEERQEEAVHAALPKGRGG